MGECDSHKIVNSFGVNFPMVYYISGSGDTEVYNINPGLINPRLFIFGGYHFNNQLLLLGGTTTTNQPGFINPGLILRYLALHVKKQRPPYILTLNFDSQWSANKAKIAISEPWCCGEPATFFTFKIDQIPVWGQSCKSGGWKLAWQLCYLIPTCQNRVWTEGGSTTRSDRNGTSTKWTLIFLLCHYVVVWTKKKSIYHNVMDYRITWCEKSTWVFWGNFSGRMSLWAEACLLPHGSFLTTFGWEHSQSQDPCWRRCTG